MVGARQHYIIAGQELILGLDEALAMMLTKEVVQKFGKAPVDDVGVTFELGKHIPYVVRGRLWRLSDRILGKESVALVFVLRAFRDILAGAIFGASGLGRTVGDARPLTPGSVRLGSPDGDSRLLTLDHRGSLDYVSVGFGDRADGGRLALQFAAAVGPP